jgi:hypothetical protein
MTDIVQQLSDIDLLVERAWYTQLLHMMRTGLYMRGAPYHHRMSAADHFEAELKALDFEHNQRKHINDA